MNDLFTAVMAYFCILLNIVSAILLLKKMGITIPTLMLALFFIFYNIGPALVRALYDSQIIIKSYQTYILVVGLVISGIALLLLIGVSMLKPTRKDKKGAAKNGTNLRGISVKE